MIIFKQSGNCRKCPTSLHPSDTSTAGFPTTIPLKGEATTREQRRVFTTATPVGILGRNEPTAHDDLNICKIQH